MMTYILSEKGKDFEENDLTEARLDGVKEVFFDKCIYDIGNRRHNIVELYRGKNFMCTIGISKIRLIQ